MSKVLGPTPASTIPDYIRYLDDLGCDVIQILNDNGYWQTIIYSEPKNVISYLNFVVKRELHAIREMQYEIDYAIMMLTSKS